jgi:hypothetical protein
MNVVGFMSANITTKRKPIHSRVTRPNGVRKKSLAAPTPLMALIERIAERGKLIPPEVQDELSREMRRSDFCIGSGPIKE